MASNIICGFCNAPWTEEMIAELDYISSECETCGYEEAASINLKITCRNCDRVIYQKDGVEINRYVL